MTSFQRTPRPIRKEVTTLSMQTMEHYELGLFVDTSFPPDQSSLTYVYSGDDKYEQMTFKRPLAIRPEAHLYGIGGIPAISIPAKIGMDRNWFGVALAVISANPKYMENVIPGFAHFEQSFRKNYVGCFRFRLWRFGEWTDVTVDDFLPTLDGTLAYFPSIPPNHEFWGALLEKAYAKCHKAYEAIEVGNPVNAITDLSGAICEHVSIRLEAPPHHFSQIYHSAVNRSLIVAIRSTKSSKSHEEDNGRMYLITAATMFPLRDGQLVEMLRVRELFSSSTWWNGEFSLRHSLSWNRVNPAFIGSYRPKECLQEDECWIGYSDFCYHFTDVFICSSRYPYEGLDKTDRRYHNHFARMNSDKTTTDNNLNSLIVGRADNNFLSVPTGVSRRASVEINVRESSNTVKVNNVQDTFFLTPKIERVRRKSFSAIETTHERTFPSTPTTEKKTFRPGKSKVNIVKDIPSIRDIPAIIHTPPPFPDDFGSDTDSRNGDTQDTVSHRSTASVNSISDIKIKVKNYERRKSAPCRPKSAPQGRGSLLTPSASLSRLFDARVDNFRSTGGWKRLLWQFGSWEKSSAGGSRNDMASHSRNPRILLHVPRTQDVAPGSSGSDVIAAAFPTVPAVLRNAGKCHVLASVMQDYRQGARTAHSMLMTIGFCVYRCKNQERPERDERKSLQKLQLIQDVQSCQEGRELTTRLDLEPGAYFIVPYTAEAGQIGDFLVRVLAEKENPTDKNACSIS